MSQNESKPSVLLVDDSIDVHRLLKARLKHEHIQLIGTTDGHKAIELARQSKPATIMLDLDMPGMDGFEILRALKEDGETHNIPIIVLSGLQSSEDKVTAFDLGATDYVTKPCDLSELRARLRATLRLSHLLKLLAERADVDGLTGLGNRAHFDKRWKEKVAECRRYKHPLSIALLDLDHFKKINDMYGHPAGDEVLTGFSELVQRHCRETDIPCRYGGEEFAVIMACTKPHDGIILADRIRIAVSEIVWPRHPEHHTTVSIGIAGTDGTTPVDDDDWIEVADQALYAAKHGGRNRVEIRSLDDEAPKLAQAG